MVCVSMEANMPWCTGTTNALLLLMVSRKQIQNKIHFPFTEVFETSIESQI